MNKWHNRIKVEPLGTVKVDGRYTQLVAFSFETINGNRFSYAWSLCVPEYMLIHKKHTYTKDKIHSKARWYTLGIKSVEDWTNIQGL